MASSVHLTELFKGFTVEDVYVDTDYNTTRILLQKRHAFAMQFQTRLRKTGRPMKFLFSPIKNPDMWSGAIIVGKSETDFTVARAGEESQTAGSFEPASKGSFIRVSIDAIQEPNHK